jgi:hypothetical protein
MPSTRIPLTDKAMIRDARPNEIALPGLDPETSGFGVRVADKLITPWLWNMRIARASGSEHKPQQQASIFHEVIFD